MTVRGPLAATPRTEDTTVHAIGAAIVNFNTRDHLLACLDSVVAQRPGAVVVVDNLSRDGSAEAVRSAHPDVVVIQNEHNRGYGSAGNQAVSTLDTPYVLLLNADTRLCEGALLALCAHLDERPGTAVVGPRLVDESGASDPSCFAFPDLRQAFLQTTFVGSLASRLSRRAALRARAYAPLEATRVPWVLGAALALRKEAFVAVGGFDESFFLYSEEVDLCYRLTRAGWDIDFTPVAQIVHVGGASAGQRLAETEPERYLATAHFYRKHYPRWRGEVLKALTRYRMLHNLVRDQLRLAFAQSPERRRSLRIQITVWHRVLEGIRDA